jgi:hypothetical protein
MLLVDGAVTSLDAQEHDREWTVLISEVRRLAKRYEAAQLRGDQLAADVLRYELGQLRGQVIYAHRRWQRLGSWTRYYQVRDGVLHTSMACRSIGLHTIMRCLPELSMMDTKDVARQYKMCRHCGHRESRAYADDDVFAAQMRRHYLIVEP